MTINEEQIRYPYVGDDVTDEWVFGFSYNETTDITLYTDIGGAGETLIDPADYTIVELGGKVGGHVLYPKTGTKLTTTDKVAVLRDTPNKNTFDFKNQVRVAPEDIESSDDDKARQLQELADLANRAVKVPVTSTDDPDDLLQSVYDSEATAVAAAATATTQAGIATSEASDSADSATASDLSRVYSSNWAINPEDTPVSIAAGGDGSTTFSALHWAAKAAAILASTVLGGASSTDNSVAVYDGATGKLLKDGGLALQIDNVNIRAGFGIFPTHQVHTKLRSDDNVFIDGATNARTITLGAVRQEHKAGIDGTRALHLDIDSNGYGDTSAIVIRQNLLGSSALIRPKGVNFHADVTGATNAHLNFMECSITGDLDASMKVDAVDVWHGMGVIDHHSGSVSAADTVFKYDGAYTDITTEAGSDSSDVSVFDATDDYLYFGNADPFGAIEVILATAAGSPGIKPTFEYSKGSSVWETLSVSDDSNGYRENGNIFYTKPSDWAVDTVNAVSNKYWVRIKRTSNCTAPTEDTMKVVVDTSYGWDKDGEILAKNVKKTKLDATVAPTVNDDSDDGFEVGSEWIDQAANATYKCVDATVGAAIWAQTNAASSDPFTATSTISGTVDWDTLTTAGLYKTSGTTYVNAPLFDKATVGSLSIHAIDGDTSRHQYWIEADTGDIWTRSYDGTNWTMWKLDCINPITAAQQYSDLFNNNTLPPFMASTVSGSGASIGNGGTSEDNTDTARLIVGATSGYVQMYFNTSSMYYTSKTGFQRFEVSNRISIALSTPSERFETIIGYASSYHRASSGSFFFQVDNENSGNWVCVTDDGGTETITNTSVIPVLNTYQEFRIEHNRDNTSVKFYIDNVLVATHTTNLHAGSLKPAVSIYRTAGTGAGRYLFTDKITRQVER